jgi:DNA-binding LytR/AlgR family response regulator
MLKVAICDDQPEDLQKLSSMLWRFIHNCKLTADVKSFSHPLDLLKSSENEHYHIYLLDVVMPMFSGIDIGKEIRRLDRNAQIIYVTTEPQYALQAYQASPLNYLIKPIYEHQLIETLNFAVSKIELYETNTFTVKTADSIRVLNLSDIISCECRKHTVIFTLSNGEEVVSLTLRDSFTKYSQPILKDDRFLQCHASFIVNMWKVERFSKDSFTLKGGKVIPIAAKQYSAVRDQFLNFLMSKEVHK